ncbi:MAG: hypothetical protein RSF39_08015 [Romboutsia sp.]
MNAWCLMLIEKIMLSKFNGAICENLFGDLSYITEEKFHDIMELFERVNRSMDNKNWLKFRDLSYLKDVLDKGGFIIGCYVDNILIASALCEAPNGDYKDILIEMGMSSDEINSTYISGYVMVDPVYRGNSLHRILMEARIKASIIREKKHIVTAIATENVFSLKTILALGFEVRMQKENEYNIVRNILVKNLNPSSSQYVEFSA